MTNKIKKISKLLAILIITFFAILGVLTSIAIYNYNFNIFKGSDFNSRFTYILSEKAAIDGWQEYENYFKSNLDENKEMGQFRRNFISDELSDKKFRIYNDEKIIKGVVFQDGGRYSAEVNTETLEFSIKEEPLIWHWHWYNWLGIGLDKIRRETLEEMVNSPLPVAE